MFGELVVDARSKDHGWTELDCIGRRELCSIQTQKRATADRSPVAAATSVGMTVPGVGQDAGSGESRG